MNYNVIGNGGFYKTREALEEALKESRGPRRHFPCPCCKEKIPWQEVLMVLRPHGFMTYFTVKLRTLERNWFSRKRTSIPIRWKS